MQHKLAQLSLAPTQKANSLGEVFIAQPDLNKEALLGKLFIIIELHSRETNDYKLANFILNELNRNYYQNDKAIMRERLKSISVEQVFESCLAKTNKNLADQLQSKKLEFKPSISHITVGVIHESSIFFSVIGKNRTFLLYKNKQITEEDKYNIKEITEKPEIGEHEINLNKIFSNIINGQLPEGGSLLFTNEALPEYIGSRQLTEIISTLPPAGAIEQIRQGLGDLNNFVSFYAILIKSTAGKLNNSEPIIEKNAGAGHSIHNLHTTESKTERLLMPTGLIDFQKWTERGKRIVNLGKDKSNRMVSASRALVKNKLPAKRRNGARALGNLKEVLLNLASVGVMSGQKLLTAIKTNSDPQKIKNGSLLLGQTITDKTLKPLKWYKKLNQKQQVVFGGGLGLIILFALNIVWMSSRQDNIEAKKNYDNLVAQIEEKENQIDSNLIYKNDEGSKSLAKEVESLLNQLPATDVTAKVVNLRTKFADQQRQIRKDIAIEPKELANLGTFDAMSEPANLNLVDNTLYSGDQNGKALYKIELESKSVSSITAGLENIKTLSRTASEENLIYYFTGESIYIFNTDKNEGKFYSIKDLDLTKITDLALYNNRLYLVAPGEQQVYRLAFQSGGFANPIAWFKESVDLNNLANTRVDGSLYLLYQNGQLLKYAKGLKDSFSLNGVEPKLETGSALATTEQAIYIADNKEKRIVMLDKNGKYLKQYRSDKLSNIKAISVDEKTKTAYVLNDKTVYSIELK